MAENRRHVGEVNVNHADSQNQLGDATNRLAQDGIGGGEGVDHRNIFVFGELHKVIVLDDDKRVHVRLHFDDAFVGNALFATTFKAERQRDDADRQHAEFLGEPCNNRSRAGARAAAHARRYENHVRARHHAFEAFGVIFGSLFAQRDTAARPATFGQFRADLHGFNLVGV